jgi:hypothetical protein
MIRIKFLLQSKSKELKIFVIFINVIIHNILIKNHISFYISTYIECYSNNFILTVLLLYKITLFDYKSYCIKSLSDSLIFFYLSINKFF